MASPISAKAIAQLIIPQDNTTVNNTVTNLADLKLGSLPEELASSQALRSTSVPAIGRFSKTHSSTSVGTATSVSVESPVVSRRVSQAHLDVEEEALPGTPRSSLQHSSKVVMDPHEPPMLLADEGEEFSAEDGRYELGSAKPNESHFERTRREWLTPRDEEAYRRRLRESRESQSEDDYYDLAYDFAYRSGIWRSKVPLSCVTQVLSDSWSDSDF